MKKIDVLGIGVSNVPLIRYLSKSGDNSITARDKSTADKIDENILAELLGLGVKTVLGEDYLKNLDSDIIFRTPGIRPDIPELLTAKENGAKITSEMELFFDICKAPIIAITGSDGKTTTSSIVYELLSKEGYNCYLGGNIGTPLIEKADEIKESDKVVLELSSFQLQSIKKSPHIAIITNFSPNHLDWHTDMDEYIEAKNNIFKFQNGSDILVTNGENELTKTLKSTGELRLFGNHQQAFVDGESVIVFGKEVLKTSEIKIPGRHNVENYMAAILAVREMVSDETIKKVAKNFGGVKHRIEFVREINGAKYYNDSIATSPTSVIACLNAFRKNVILIAGGYDKNLDYTELGKAIAKHAKALILVGNTAEKIDNATKMGGGNVPTFHFEKDFKGALQKAHELAKEGDTVVLSPASASFDMFKNFEERGNIFKEIVEAL